MRGEATADLVTSGLHALLGAELVAPWVATDKSTQEDREALLAYIRDYVVSERAIVRAGETITYGY